MKKITLMQGDITKIKVDVIVNAANSSLLGGGGVDGAIHRAGGNDILNECRAIRERQGSLVTGKAVITTGGRLPTPYVIHTVGPVYSANKKDEMKLLLQNCYQNSLQLALENDLMRIAFPNISTGIYKFPKEDAAKIAIQTVNDFLKENEEIEEVIFVCFDSVNFRYYEEIISREG